MHFVCVTLYFYITISLYVLIQFSNFWPALIFRFCVLVLIAACYEIDKIVGNSQPMDYLHFFVELRSAESSVEMASSRSMLVRSAIKGYM